MRQQHARLLRSTVITTVIIALSTGAHAIAGGTLPAPGVVVALASLTMLAVMLTAKRPQKLPALLAILGGGQLALHQTFEWTATTASCAPMGHAHHAAMTCTTGTPVAGHAHGLDGGPGTAMLVGHALATLVTAIVITRGEEALYATLAWLTPLFSTPGPRVITPTVRPGIQGNSSEHSSLYFLVAPALRGPPRTSH